jgi:hypothetical protein
MDVIEEVVEETAKVHFRFKLERNPRHVMQLNDISETTAGKSFSTTQPPRLNEG